MSHQFLTFNLKIARQTLQSRFYAILPYKNTNLSQDRNIRTKSQCKLCNLAIVPAKKMIFFGKIVECALRFYWLNR